MTHIGRKLGLIVAAVAAVAMLSAATASADDTNVNFTLDNGVINMSTTWAKIVDPTLDPPDAPASLSANVADDGTLTAAKEDFVFPNKTIKDLETGNSLLPVVDAKIAIAAVGDITGDFDIATGESSVVIPTKATITVYSAGSPSSVARCGVSGFSLNLGTTGELNDPGDATADPPRPATDYEASPFDPSADNAGALVATWASLPNAVAEAGSLGSIVCPAVDGLIGGPGGIWLEGTAKPGEKPNVGPPELAPNILTGPTGTIDSNSATFTYEKGTGEPQAVTGFECKLDAGEWAACDDATKTYGGVQPGAHTFSVHAKNDLGNGPDATRTWTVKGGEDPTCATDPSLCPKTPKLGALKVSPAKKTVKRGKKATFTAKIPNVGDGTAAGVKICVSAPKKLVKVKKCVNVGSLGAGSTAKRAFKVTAVKKAKKGKKAKLKFTASAPGLAKKTATVVVKLK